MDGKASYIGMQRQAGLARLSGVLDPKSATSEVPYVLGMARLSPSTPSYWLGANQGTVALAPMQPVVLPVVPGLRCILSASPVTLDIVTRVGKASLGW